MSDKGSNSQELVIGIVFRGAAGTQDAIHLSKYRFLQVSELSIYFYPFLKKIKKELSQHPKVNNLSSGNAFFPRVTRALSIAFQPHLRHLQAGRDESNPQSLMLAVNFSTSLLYTQPLTHIEITQRDFPLLPKYPQTKECRCKHWHLLPIVKSVPPVLFFLKKFTGTIYLSHQYSCFALLPFKSLRCLTGLLCFCPLIFKI